MDALLTLIVKWQTKIPSWLRWILFIPISGIITTLLFFPLRLIISLLGVPEGLSTAVYAIIWQINFLVLVFYTVPKQRLLCLSILTALRAGFLILFLAGLGISMFRPDVDFVEFRELITELLILLSSLYVIKIYKGFKPTDKDGLLTIKYSFIFSVIIIISIIIDKALIYLADVPYIGWFFRYIKHMRDSVMG